jgi:tripartite-type tricarboxylate transporter receptor subunit TctC
MTNRRRGVSIALSAIAGLCLGATGPATAQPYPHKTIKMIMPSTAGSPTDVMARLLARHLSLALRQPVIVDDRPGGGGIIGAKAVMSAEPDGYTLLFTEGAKHLMTPEMNKNPGYDPVRDFVPVANAAGGAFVLVVAPNVPAQSARELAEYAKANPGKVNFGFGMGTIPQVLGESFRRMTRTDIASIPYKGGAQAVTDMLAGQIQMNFGTTATLLPLIRQGKLRALAVTSPTRSPDLPDVPTMTESGFPELALGFWMGVWAPAATLAAIVDKLNAAVNESLKSPEMKAALARIGFEPRGGSPQDFAAFIAAEAPRWAAIVKSSGAKMD